MELLRSFVKVSFTTAHGGMAWTVLSMLPAFLLRACQKTTGRDFVPHGPVGSFFAKYMPEGAFTWVLWLVFAAFSFLVAIGFYNAKTEEASVPKGGADEKPKRQRKKPESAREAAPPSTPPVPHASGGAYAGAAVEAPEFGSLYRGI